ncbi:MMPL family transporter [Catenulispora rubra]|uniref:MMPL family transporter n=1 Tax=Catenulispora rubra TaxID=280293 RepID=UPI00189285DB|nr:MMPL family transporter [Catenulispora rubra]
MRGITTLVLRHKLVVALCWLAMAVAGLATLGSTVNRLTTDFALPGQPGYVADQKISALYHDGGDTLPALLTVTVPPEVETSAVSQQAHQIFAAVAAVVPNTRLADAQTTGDPKFTTADGRTTFAFLFAPPEKGFGTDTTTPRLRAAASGAAPAGWQIGVTGATQLASGNGSSKGNGVLVEVLLGSLGALAVLAYVFGSLLAFLPLLMAGVAIPSTFLLINGLSRITSVSSLVEFLVALIGLGVAIDYSLLVVTRWREERDNGADNDSAVELAMQHAGRAVVFSGLTVAVSLLAMLVVPVPVLRNMAVAGFFIPLVSIGVAVTLLPVLLAAVGSRIDRPRWRRETHASRPWSAWARFVLRHRKSAAVVGAGVLVALVVPLTSMRLGEPPSAASAQRGAAHDVLVRLTDGGVPSGALAPIEVLTTPDAAGSVAARMASVPGVYTAFAASSFRAGGTAIVDVVTVHEPSTTAGNAEISAVQDAARPLPGVLGVGGSGPTQNDFIHAVYGSFPLMLTVISLLTLVLLTRAFRSLVLAAKAVLFNLLSVGAAYGVMVLVWQDGRGSHALWGVPATGSVTVWVPIMVFAFLFGLSMDYEVFILTRMREEYDATGDTDRAVVTGIGRTGRLVTSAALILFLSFLSMSTTPTVDVKVLATGLGAGILLDAVVVRALLVPALVGVLGRWNWWLPGWAAPLLRVAPSPVAPAERERAAAGAVAAG